jgi:hypothetical protein
VIVLTFAIAAVSYYVVEQPIRRGRIARATTPRPRRISRRRITLAAIPVSLLTVACISVAVTQVPAISPSVPSLMLVGDSVPLQLTVAFERALSDRGWRLVSVTAGACSVTGETMARPDGKPMDKADPCSAQIVQDQDRAVIESDPDLVIWWDRWSVSHFITSSGEFVRSGSTRFWELRRRGLREAVDRLTSGGATVVFVGTEPPGESIERYRCTESRCPNWIRFQLDHYGNVTSRWNSIMRDFAERHPNQARFVSVTGVICATDVAPCDDQIDGVPARPDGTHYKGVGEDLVIATLLQLLAPVMEPLQVDPVE